jgi:hypothetical protein
VLAPVSAPRRRGRQEKEDTGWYFLLWTEGEEERYDRELLGLRQMEMNWIA